MEQIRDRILKLEQIEWRRLKELQPSDLKHVLNSKHIRQSIQKNGFAFPFAVWQDATGDIYAIDGHTRKDVLHGMDNVPDTLPAFFIAADDREDAIRILLEVYNQRHNEINTDVLTEWLKVEAISVETVNISSLDTAETKQAKTEVTEDEYDDTLPEHPETVPGDLYEIGVHRLLCGDSMDSNHVARLMNGDNADIVFTDPPYGVAYVGKTKDALTIESDDVSPEKLKEYVTAWFSNVDLATRPGAYLLATVPPGPLHLVFAQDWLDRGWLRQIMVWNKSCMVMGHSEYHYKHEPILFGWKPGGVRLKSNDRTKTTVWDFDRPNANREHPTMKPVSMWAYGIGNHSKVGDIVFEPFAGGGTTMVASEQLSRRCYAIEILPKYCDVIVKRMVKLNPSLIIKRNGEDVTDFWKEKAAQT